MSKLGLHVRPVVMFDPSNKLHRQWVVDFFKSGSWRDCPVRFAVREDQGNLMAHIQKELLLWYADQEEKGKLIGSAKPGRKSIAGLTGGGFELKL